MKTKTTNKADLTLKHDSERALHNRCFVEIKNGKMQSQGWIRGEQDGYFLVDYFESLMGGGICQTLVPKSKVFEGDWRFFDTDDWLREYLDARPSLNPFIEPKAARGRYETASEATPAGLDFAVLPRD